MKIRREPLIMISEMSGSWIKCAIGRRNGRITSKLMSEGSRGEVIEVARVHVEVVRLEIAVRRRLGIEAVVRQDDGLGVLELCEELRLEHVVEDEAVRLRRTDRGPLRGRAAGQHADMRVLSRFGDRVAGFETLRLAAEIRRPVRAEVIRQREEDLRPQPL